MKSFLLTRFIKVKIIEIYEKVNFKGILTTFL